MVNRKIEIKWAALFVAMTLVWMMMEKSLGWHDEHISNHEKLTNLIAIPAIALYVLAIMERRKFQDGALSWMDGFISGIWITALVALVSPVTQVVINTLISPDYFQHAIEHAVSSGNATREEAESFFNLKSYMIYSVIGALIIGTATSAIVAFVLKKRAES